MLARARRPLTEFDHSPRVVRETAALRNSCIVLGCAPTIAASCGPALLSTFERDEPNVRVFLRAIASDALLESLYDGSIDHATAQVVPAEPDLLIEVLHCDPIVVPAPCNFLPRRRTHISLKELSTLPLLHLAPATSMRQLFDAEMKSRPSLSLPLRPPAQPHSDRPGRGGIGDRDPAPVCCAARGQSITQVIPIRPASLARDIAGMSRSDRPPSPAAKRLADLARHSISPVAIGVSNAAASTVWPSAS